MKKSENPFKKIVFVCINRREEGRECCSEKESEAILKGLKARVKEVGLAGKIRISKSGCHDVCAQGPSVMVFPDNVWYSGVTPDDIETLFQDLCQGLEHSLI